jgi:hypothetical protein
MQARSMMRESGKSSNSRRLQTRCLAVVVTAAVLVSGASAGCGRPHTVPGGIGLCVEMQPSVIEPVVEPLPEALRTPTWRHFYSSLSDTDIAQSSNLTREQLDLRANLQVESATLIPWLTRRYPNEVGQTWLDQRAGSIVVTSTAPDAMRSDPQLVLYPHQSYVAITQAEWSQRRVDTTRECLVQRISNVDPNAQLRFYEAAGEIGIEAADNGAGRAALANAAIAHEVAASEGILATKLHPFEVPRTDG